MPLPNKETGTITGGLHVNWSRNIHYLVSWAKNTIDIFISRPRAGYPGLSDLGDREAAHFACGERELFQTAVSQHRTCNIKTESRLKCMRTVSFPRSMSSCLFPERFNRESRRPLSDSITHECHMPIKIRSQNNGQLDNIII